MKRKGVSFFDKRAASRRIRLAAVFLLALFLLSLFVTKLFVFSAASGSSAMETSISQNCLVLVSPLCAPMPSGKLRQKLSKISSANRGDIVFVELQSKRQNSFFYELLDSFVNFLTLRRASLRGRLPAETENCFFRRIAAMPGDTIYMKDFVLHIKPAGQPYFFTEFELSSKPYEVKIQKQPAGWIKSVGVASDFGEILLDENEYFLLADERNDSADSRLWGAIHASKIAGKAVLQYFPFSKFSRL